MHILSNNDYKLLQSLLSAKEKSLLNTMKSYLDKKYDKVYSQKDYIMAIGDIPVAVVAHLDTVFNTPPADIYYDTRKGVLWSPDGLGADDRAGVFAILKLLQKDLKPTVIFTTGEESGGLGASSLITDFPSCPVLDLRYIIQLDRKGKTDCVFYDCDNQEFIDYIEKFGFIENFGSFSDISVICPAWKVAGVNLSIGYEDEHSYSETLHVNPLFATIAKVQTLLTQKMEEVPFFAYIPAIYSATGYPGYSTAWGFEEYPYDTMYCCNCQKVFSEYEMFPVKRLNGTTGMYCPDCIVDNVDWCEVCNSAFEIDKNAKEETHICKDCQELLDTKWKKISKKSKTNSKK